LDRKFVINTKTIQLDRTNFFALERASSTQKTLLHSGIETLLHSPISS